MLHVIKNTSAGVCKQNSYGRENVLFTPQSINKNITDIKLTLNVGEADSLSFKIYPNHYLYSTIKNGVRKQTISVVDIDYLNNITTTTPLLFYGEIDSVQTDVYGVSTVYVVGAMSFLKNGYVYSATAPSPSAAPQVFSKLVADYNLTSGGRRSVSVGTLPPSTNSREMPQTYGVIYDAFEELTNYVSAFYQTEYVLQLKYTAGSATGVLSMVQLNSYGISDTPIQLGVNIISGTERNDGADICTYITVVDEANHKYRYSVGKPSDYGIIEKIIKVKGNLNDETLKGIAVDYARYVESQINSIDVRALCATPDGELIYKVGERVNVDFNGASYTAPIWSMSIYLDRPEQNSCEVGIKKKEFVPSEIEYLPDSPPLWEV